MISVPPTAHLSGGGQVKPLWAQGLCVCVCVCVCVCMITDPPTAHLSGGGQVKPLWAPWLCSLPWPVPHRGQSAGVKGLVRPGQEVGEAMWSGLGVVRGQYRVL